MLILFLLTHLTISLSLGSLIDPLTDEFYYSHNVTQANNKFISACNFANGAVERIGHPNSGVNGERLETIVCAVGDSSARSAVYTISGTHGVEGYAGSMAQISMLRGPPSMFPGGVRMVHVHMLNPYGASHVLKENENNVDQYKNVAGYYALNYDNPIAQELIDGIDLPNLNNETVRQNAFGLFGQLIQRHGPTAVNNALKTGQGKRPQGIAYFGTSKSWSTLTHEDVVRRYLQGIDNLLLIDWHTAVGPYGEWTFVPIDEETDAAFKRWAPGEMTTENDVLIPTGGDRFYTDVGRTINLKTYRRCAWEAGTYEVTMATNSMFMERLHCRFYGNPNTAYCQNITQQTLEFFYPQGADWKRMTYNRINDLLPKVLSGFAAESSDAKLKCRTSLPAIIMILFLNII